MGFRYGTKGLSHLHFHFPREDEKMKVLVRTQSKGNGELSFPFSFQQEDEKSKVNSAIFISGMKKTITTKGAKNYVFINHSFDN